MGTNLNISSVISPDVLKTISQSTAIKTFGDQLKDTAKEKIISVVRNKTTELEGEIEKLIKQRIQLDLDHPTELKRLEILHNNKEITDEQYKVAVEAENKAYQKQLDAINAQITKLKKDIADIVKDPYDKAKKEKARLLQEIKNFKTKLKTKRTKSKSDRIKKVLKNAAKTLAPIVALELANRFTVVISQRKQLEALVDQVNLYIVQANTPETITIATNLRNNTVTLINNSINKLNNLEKTLSQISIYITIFSAIIAVLSALPIPTAVPPGIGVPVSLITKIVKTLEKANKLVLALNTLLAIATVLLENEISKLNDLINQLKQVNQLLDGKTLNLDEQSLTDLTNSFRTNVDQFPMYKGFKFKLKEEQNPAFVVKGNKRHYAVAIDRDGVEAIKSEYSFTLDPNDLVEQLKLVIDQKNLQG